jgi:hypothetical protein
MFRRSRNDEINLSTHEALLESKKASMAVANAAQEGAASNEELRLSIGLSRMRTSQFADFEQHIRKP